MPREGPSERRYARQAVGSQPTFAECNCEGKRLSLAFNVSTVRQVDETDSVQADSKRGWTSMEP